MLKKKSLGNDLTRHASKYTLMRGTWQYKWIVSLFYVFVITWKYGAEWKIGGARFIVVPVAWLSADRLAELSFHRENMLMGYYSEQPLSLRGCRCRSDLQHTEHILACRPALAQSVDLYRIVKAVVAKYICCRDGSRCSCLSEYRIFLWMDVQATTYWQPY